MIELLDNGVIWLVVWVALTALIPAAFRVAFGPEDTTTAPVLDEQGGRGTHVNPQEGDRTWS